MVKTFGDFEFDCQRRRLTAGGQPVKLTGQAVDLLALLLERPGELVTRDDLERRLWPDTNVDVHHSLDVVVSRLRAALGDKGSSPRYVETVPRRGYRFIEPVTVLVPEAPLANQPRRRIHPLLVYTAVAVVAAIVAILIARTRYDRFVPPRSPQTPATALAR